MPRHPLTNFEIQKHYQNEPKFNGVYSRIKDGTNLINLNEYKSIGTHWRALYVNGNSRIEQYILIALELIISQKELKNS